jgi:hypothetical protein
VKWLTLDSKGLQLSAGTVFGRGVGGGGRRGLSLLCPIATTY